MRAALDESDEAVKEQVLERLAFGGGTNDHFTNPAPAGSPPTLYHAPALAKELIKLVHEKGRLATPALKALAALELDERQLSALADEAYPTPILRQTSADQNTASDENQRNIYLGLLRVLTAQRERAKTLAGKISKVLEQERAPGLKEAPESLRPTVEADWDAYQADAAQTLLAIHGDINPHLDHVFALWVKLNSPAYIRRSKPHERLISPCALGSASPDRLADEFAKKIKSEEDASTSTSTFLLVDALTGLACTGTQKPEHLSLVASVFNSHVDPNEPLTLGGKIFQDAKLNFWRGARPESVRGAAAAALIRLGAAGGQDMPSIKEALEGINRSDYGSIDESSLPGPEWLVKLHPDFHRGLTAAASEQLGASDERLRVVAARVLTNLWLAGVSEEESAARLLEAARANADVESLRALLLMAHTNRATHARKSQVKEFFKSLLEQNQGTQRTNAVVALGSLYVKDESPRIRSGITTYVPAPMDDEFAKEFAPALAAVYKSLAGQQEPTRRAEVLRALGSARASEQILNIIASEDLRDNRLWVEALDAAAMSGPFKLPGVCLLLDMSAKDASVAVPARAAAYYVSDDAETARLLISTLGKQPPAGARNQSADGAGDRLRAIHEALNQCKVSRELLDALGPRVVELARTPGGERNASLLYDIAAKYQEMPFADEIMKAAGIEGTWTGTWYHVWYYIWWYVIGATLLVGLLYAGWRTAFVKKPLRRLSLYEKVPDGTLPIPWTEKELSLRPAARLVLRPFHRRVLDAWVECYVADARTKYMRYCQKADPWPRPVKVNDERLLKLEPRNVQHIFSGNQAITLVVGGNAPARSKMAYLLGRWAMAEQSGDRLCRKHLMLPIIIKGSPELLEQQEGDPFLREVKGELRSLIMIEGTILEELLLHLLRKRRVLVIIDDFPGNRAKGVRRFVRRMSQYPINAIVIASPKGDDLAPLTTATIHIDP